jgi:hypothetical protein
VVGCRQGDAVGAPGPERRVGAGAEMGRQVRVGGDGGRLEGHDITVLIGMAIGFALLLAGRGRDDEI